MEKINITGLDKADVLAVLYNAAKPLGLGFLAYNSKPMTKEEAQKVLERSSNFGYLNGRVMKIDISEDEIDIWLYDRDNGLGSAERAILALRSTSQTNPKAVEEEHKTKTLKSVIDAERIPKETHDIGTVSILGIEGKAVMVGLDETAEPLYKKLDEVKKELGGL